MSRSPASLIARNPEPGSESHELRYVARAGLLPELSSQTYNSFYQALREAVLNAIDAGASRVDIDLSNTASGGDLVVTDNGRGMTLREFNQYFMSLGGSAKFGDASTFGRIGIGSLALLHHGGSATVETKTAVEDSWTVARIGHRWQMDRSARTESLGDLAAGLATVERYAGRSNEHFTRVRIHDVASEVGQTASDPVAFYELVETLRRVLPLPWAGSRVIEALRTANQEALEILEAHVKRWSVDVYMHSEWERNIRLTRRLYGDLDEKEVWSGVPRVLAKRIRVPEANGSRTVMIGGFLLHQHSASAAWSGLTARVQNVAVEEGTFFDVTGDAGFRKYITGEVYLFGEVDQDRLINIDRSSFNRESSDYQAVQRYLSREIQSFKNRAIQASQRRKVTIRKHLTERLAVVDSVSRVVECAANLVDWPRLPSSNNGRISGPPCPTIEGALDGLGAVLGPECSRGGAIGLSLEEGSDEITVTAPVRLIAPAVDFNGCTYAIKLVQSSGRGAPVVIKNRPREIVFDANHVAHTGASHGGYHVTLALELAHLLAERQEAALYETMLLFAPVL